MDFRTDSTNSTCCATPPGTSARPQLRRRDSASRSSTPISGWSRDVWSSWPRSASSDWRSTEADGGRAQIGQVAAVLTEIGRRLAPEPVVHAALGPGGLIADAGHRRAAQRFSTGSPRARRCSPSPTRSRDRAGPRSTCPQGRTRRRVVDADRPQEPGLAGDCADTDRGQRRAARTAGRACSWSTAGADGLRRPATATFDGQRGAQIDLDGVRRRAARRAGRRVGAHRRTPSIRTSRRCAPKRSARWRRRCG